MNLNSNLSIEIQTPVRSAVIFLIFFFFNGFDVVVVQEYMRKMGFKSTS